VVGVPGNLPIHLVFSVGCGVFNLCAACFEYLPPRSSRKVLHERKRHASISANDIALTSLHSVMVHRRVPTPYLKNVLRTVCFFCFVTQWPKNEKSGAAAPFCRRVNRGIFEPYTVLEKRFRRYDTIFRKRSTLKKYIIGMQSDE